MERLPLPEPSNEVRPGSADRWELIRDVIVFQVKLMFDAVRDVVLSPISIVAGLIDLVAGGNPAGRNFHRVLAAGGRAEAWINLFDRVGREAKQESVAHGAPTVDVFVTHVERLIVEQYERGGVTASAKDAIDRSLDAIARKKPR